MAIVIFLQNAWSPVYAGRAWPRASWLRALERSRSGQRLKLLTANLDECEEVTPRVSATPDGIEPVEKWYVREILAQREPRLVIACGRHAEAALIRLWEGPLLAVPHLAARVLTDVLYIFARSLFDTCTERLALRQTRTGIMEERL
jgi:hypothetical protein